MGFWPDFGHFFHFDGHFSAISGVGPFSIFSPIFLRDFCSGPVSHSVNGHFNHEAAKQPREAISQARKLEEGEKSDLRFRAAISEPETPS